MYCSKKQTINQSSLPAIRNALKDENITPEQEEKLLSQLQDGGGIAALRGRGRARSKGRGKPGTPIDPATGEPMDDEWQPVSWKTKINALRKKV